MNENPKHLISELGVLKSFSIGRHVSPKTIQLFRKKIEGLDKSDKEKEDLLRRALIRESKKSFDMENIPGIILERISSPKRMEVEKRFVDLTYFATLIVKKASEKKLSKFDLCYFINALISMFDLEEKDFENFHKKFYDFEEGNIDDPREE